MLLILGLVGLWSLFYHDLHVSGCITLHAIIQYVYANVFRVLYTVPICSFSPLSIQTHVNLFFEWDILLSPAVTLVRLLGIALCS